MNYKHHGVKLWNWGITGWKVCCALLVALSSALHASTVTANSGNTSVDTTVAAVNVLVSMRRATSAVLENAGNVPDIDEPLRVSGTNLALLASQPSLPPWNSTTGTGGGLVADGVTPLIFRIAASGTLPAGVMRYEVSLTVQSFTVMPFPTIPLVQPSPKLSAPGILRSTERMEVTLTAMQPEAYVVLNPIRAEDISSNPSVTNGPVVAHLNVADAITGTSKGGIDFGISRPPVVLVHGYNVDSKEWGDPMTAALAVDRAPGFVIPIGYGIPDENTKGQLRDLARLLHLALRFGIEEEGFRPLVLNQWAWTRYDAVGHSQGGVLLRLLCSTENKVSGGSVWGDGFAPWRTDTNKYRGRFHRVVTIGSPHAGSTIAHLAIRMKDRGVGIPSALSSIPKFTRLLQRKFMIDNGGPNRPETVQQVNRQFQCDPFARIHAFGTTISDSAQAYSLLQINNASRKSWLLPLGSDGIVDLRSQCASANGPSTANTSRITAGQYVAHAGDGIPILDIFGTNEADVSSDLVAAPVAALLKGPASTYGSIDVAESFHQTMITTAGAIETIVTEMEDAQRRFALTMIAGLPPLPGFLVPFGVGVQAVGDQVINLVVDPPAGESPNGPVQWEAVVYGPSGVTTQGLTLQTSGIHGEQLTLTIAAAVQGQVVLMVSFPSTSGKTAIGTPTVVLSRPPGTTLTGIALNPATVQGRVNVEVPLTVNGIYDGQITTAIFTTQVDTTFQSSNPAVATVDADGHVKFLGLGMATITATYNGTLTAMTAVTVLDVAPMVTSAASVSGAVGQSFTHQLTASQTVQTYAATPLPPGLTLNVQTGLISGMPTAQGATSALVSVTNANGTGSRQVDFTIIGPNTPPTDLGLDASGVSGQKPAGTLVGRLVTTDANPLDTFTYQLVAGTGATNNASFTIAGERVYTGAVLNRAVTPTVSLRVRTTDSSGATFEKAFVLLVMAPPAITRQPDPRHVFVGDPVVFAVGATGLEPLAYQWKKNGANLASANSRILDLGAATLAQAGNYSVTVTNGDGTATSVAAGLIVDPVSYEKWLSQVAGATSAVVYDPMGDFNKDGVVNFLEFAFGVQPGGSGTAALPMVSRNAAGLVFTYREATGVEPLTYEILQSTNLVTWTLFVPAPGNVSRANNSGYSLVSVRVPSPNPNLFLKLRVSSGFGSSADADGLPDEWEIANWGTTAGHGPLDDFDHDGVVELLEYAFGGDPKTPDAANLPAAVNEGGYLTVTLTKRPGVTFLVETAPDLQAASWSAANTTVLIDNSILLKVRDNVLIGGAGSRYLRVRVIVGTQ